MITFEMLSKMIAVNERSFIVALEMINKLRSVFILLPITPLYNLRIIILHHISNKDGEST